MRLHGEEHCKGVYCGYMVTPISLGCALLAGKHTKCCSRHILQQPGPVLSARPRIRGAGCIYDGVLSNFPCPRVMTGAALQASPGSHFTTSADPADR